LDARDHPVRKIQIALGQIALGQIAPNFDPIGDKGNRFSLARIDRIGLRIVGSAPASARPASRRQTNRNKFAVLLQRQKENQRK
jgi:hypothetical protein